MGLISSSARYRVLFARFRAEALIMPVRTASGGAARPQGQALGLPARSALGVAEARLSRVAKRSRSDAEGALDRGGAAPHDARRHRRPQVQAYRPCAPSPYLIKATT
jgi:hypothetical protein